MSAAARFGFTEGLATPTRGVDNSLGLVTVAGERGLFSSEERAFLHAASHAIFAAAESIDNGSATGRPGADLQPARNRLRQFARPRAFRQADRQSVGLGRSHGAVPSRQRAREMRRDFAHPSCCDRRMSCFCPDWADMCKHVAATLYGVGARLDADPDLLFTLRGVDRAELVSTVGADLPLTRTAAASDRVLADDDVAALFGLEMGAPVATIQKAERGGTKKARRGSGKTAAATRPAGDAKPVPAKKKRASGALAPSRSLAAKTRARQTGESVATTKPPPEPKSPAAPRPKRGSAAPTPASVSLPPPSEPKAAKPRRFDPQPVGGARAAKWIGARRRKADR